MNLVGKIYFGEVLFFPEDDIAIRNKLSGKKGRWRLVGEKQTSGFNDWNNLSRKEET